MTKPHDQEQAVVSDAEIRRMLEAFAGRPDPAPTRGKSRHRATRRTLALVAAGTAVLGLAVPGSLALLSGHSETPKQFFNDRTQPANAKKVILHLLRLQGFHWGELKTITNVVTARTPDGELRVYALRFSHSYLGTAVISSRKGGTASATAGPASASPERLCPSGWALWANGGAVDWPGRTYAYIVGRVSAKVASVHVLYRNGSTTKGAVANGYFLAWIKPRAAYSKVTVVADNTAGKTIGRLHAGGEGQVIHRAGVSERQQSCGT